MGKDLNFYLIYLPKNAKFVIHEYEIVFKNRKTF